MKAYKDDDIILRVKCKEIEEIQPWVLDLCDKMWDTMTEQHAMGLAANQIGCDCRIVTIDAPEFQGVMINPVIEHRTEETFHFVECCLSVPDMGLSTGKRSKEILVSYRNIEGGEERLWTTNETSAIIQHEVDHLDGKVFVDYLDGRIK